MLTAFIPEYCRGQDESFSFWFYILIIASEINTRARKKHTLNNHPLVHLRLLLLLFSVAQARSERLSGRRVNKHGTRTLRLPSGGRGQVVEYSDTGDGGAAVSVDAGMYKRGE